MGRGHGIPGAHSGNPSRARGTHLRPRQPGLGARVPGCALFLAFYFNQLRTTPFHSLSLIFPFVTPRVWTRWVDFRLPAQSPRSLESLQVLRDEEGELGPRSQGSRSPQAAHTLIYLLICRARPQISPGRKVSPRESSPAAPGKLKGPGQLSLEALGALAHILDPGSGNSQRVQPGSRAPDAGPESELKHTDTSGERPPVTQRQLWANARP